jgi:hypothetical protein
VGQTRTEERLQRGSIFKIREPDFRHDTGVGEPVSSGMSKERVERSFFFRGAKIVNFSIKQDYS